MIPIVTSLINWISINISTLISFSLHVFKLSGPKIIINYQFQYPVISNIISHAVPQTMHVRTLKIFLRFSFRNSVRRSNSNDGLPVGHVKYKDSLPTANQKEARRLSSLIIGHIEDRGLHGRNVWEKTLLDFPGVAAGNWPRRMEQFGDRKCGRRRVDYRL
jgi:hypothetical protein